VHDERAERDDSGDGRAQHRHRDRRAQHRPVGRGRDRDHELLGHPGRHLLGHHVVVPMAWSTRNAQSVVFEVDGAPVTAGAGYPLSGTGNAQVPCDGKEHEVALVASGPGGRASVSRQVNTSTSPPPVGAPLITRFHVLEDVTCPGGTAEVAASWVTQNAQAVSFSVDGQPLPAAAGFPTSGTGNIAVPCDGSDHKVTLTATGTGPAAASSRSVNTTVSTSPTSPTLPTSPVTAAPATR
jgi:hypothetical protein